MSEYSVPVNEIFCVVEQLHAKGGDAAFAVLMYKSPYALAGEDPYINLQYSVIDGVLGLDWVLLGPRNIEDKERIAAFITRAGHGVTECEMNGVGFLRVEDRDVADLGFRIVTEYYQIEPNAEIALRVEGFDYEPVQHNEERPAYNPARGTGNSRAACHEVNGKYWT